MRRFTGSIGRIPHPSDRRASIDFEVAHHPDLDTEVGAEHRFNHLDGRRRIPLQNADMLAVVVLHCNTQPIADPPNSNQHGVMAHGETVPTM